MDGASGAFAVVSAAIQLAQTINQINKFLRNVSEVPKELSALTEDLDILYALLAHVRGLVEQHQDTPCTPSPTESITLIASALETCKTRIDLLSRFLKGTKRTVESQSRLQRQWGSLKFVLKKEDLQGLQKQLRDATATLQMAISINTAQLQYCLQIQS